MKNAVVFYYEAKIITENNAEKINETRWRLHFARLSKGAQIDQKLTPAIFFFKFIN